MARNGSNIVVTKQDLKLEAFLRVHLSEDIYDKIRTYEPCIVNTSKEKRVFKYMVLTDERIYITENPPKAITDVDSVHLGNVTNIDLINDFPDFLQGEQRGNALHIHIKYTKDVTAKVKKKKKYKSKDQNQHGIPDTFSKWQPYSDTELYEPAEAGTPSIPSLGFGSTPRHHSLDESEFLKESHFEDELDENDNSSQRLTSSLPTNELKLLAMSVSDTSSESDATREEAGKKRANSISGVDMCRPLPQRPSNNPSKPIPSVDQPGTYTSQIATTLVNRQKSSPSSMASLLLKNAHRDLPSSDSVVDAKNSFLFSTSGTDRTEESALDKMQCTIQGQSSPAKLGRTQSLEAPLHCREEIEDPNMEIVELVNAGNQDMHLYVLSATSPILMHLRSAWNNYTINSTLLQQPDYAESRGYTKANGRERKHSREQLARLFQQLKDEILKSADYMESLFHLVQELSNAAEKYFFLKKLFWKSDDLFNFIVAQLHRYLPKSSCNLYTDRGRHHRADELELCTLLLETLGVMFRGTEMICARLDTLVANNGKPTLDLVVLTTCLPEVPQKWRPPKTKAVSLLLETDTEHWKTYADAEVAKLVQELCNASTAVMFDLILIAYQANWGNDEGRFFNICWLMKVLDSLQATTYTFVERLLAQAMKLLLPSGDPTLNPRQAVLLFQQFFLLQTFLQYSTCVPSHIRNNYTEEFKYYVQSPYILKKLPSKYPIAKPTLQLIGEVLSAVLQRPTTLQSTK